MHPNKFLYSDIPILRKKMIYTHNGFSTKRIRDTQIRVGVSTFYRSSRINIENWKTGMAELLPVNLIPNSHTIFDR